MKQQANLLKRISYMAQTPGFQVDLSVIEKLITKTIPAELAKNAPSNFPELYFDFTQEYERFKEFILFDHLIGKNIVALGGSFSSGKSSFLNSIMGEELLPSDITPSTSVPAYLIYDTKSIVYGINAFESRIMMEPEEVSLIAHGFGKNDADKTEIKLGHLLKSLFIASPKQPFAHLALLDTPGYSNAESERYVKQTDEKIARTQLNTANFILWFVPVDGGTIKNSDIEFLRTLNPDIPKLVIVSKADKDDDGVEEVTEKIRDILQSKSIQVIDVVADSVDFPEEYDREKIMKYLEGWNNAVTESRFAYNFKVLFMKCKNYYEQLILERRKYLSRIRKSIAYSEHDFVLTFLNELNQKTIAEINELKNMEETLTKLSDVFFKEMRRISDMVGIDMPEPTEIDLIDDRMGC